MSNFLIYLILYYMDNEKIDAYVINLKESIERKEYMIKEFEGTCINLNFIEATKFNPGWVGCLKSHLSIIQMAKDKGMKYVIVLEDDCEIINKQQFNEKFKIIKKFIDERNDWQVFNVGVNLGPYSRNLHHEIFENNHIFKISKCYSTGFIIYNSNIYDHYLYYLNFINEGRFKNTYKIDMIHRDQYVMTPLLVKQKNGFENTIKTGERMDLDEIFNVTCKIIKKFMRKI